MTMSFKRRLQNLRPAVAPTRAKRTHRRQGLHGAATHRLHFESLEDRRLLAFIGPVDYEVGTNPQAVVTADFNNDNRLDLATANYDGTVSFLLGNGQGGFGAANQFAAGSSPRSLAVGDFDNDGTRDLVAANPDGVSTLLGNGDGAFQPTVNTAFWWGALSVAASDFNADGKMDIAYTSVDQPHGVDEGFVQVLLGDGRGGFALGYYEYISSNSPVGLAVADLNADGKPDVVTANEDRSTVSVLLGNGDGTLGAERTFATGPIPQAVAVGDFTGDGIPDLVTTGYWSGWVDVLPGRGDGTFTARIQNFAYLGDSIAPADFNGDGKLDVVTALWSSENVSVLLGRGDGTFMPPDEAWAGSSITDVAVGDFNGDGRPDVAAADWGFNAVSVLLNDGNWSSVPPTPPAVSIHDVTVTEGAGVQAVFTVMLSAVADVSISVNYATANGSATAGSDYTAASGQVTFTPGQLSRTVTVNILDGTIFEPTETFLVNLSGPTAGATLADSQAIGTILDDDPAPSTKFYVVDDASQNLTYEYDPAGSLVESYSLNSGSAAPRGATSTVAGDMTWVVDANTKVYVYDTTGGLLGSWTAGSLAKNATVEGIATNGTDIWIVDARNDRVYRYAGAATRLSGSQNAASNFALNSGNRGPKGMTTDGSSLWVVNDNSTDKVFKYTTGGSLLGSWTISGGGGKPTGVTIDPANVSDIWIVDSSTDRVYQYSGAASRTSGSQSASATFNLASGNTNPQGIADPPVSAFDALVEAPVLAAQQVTPGARRADALSPPAAALDAVTALWTSPASLAVATVSRFEAAADTAPGVAYRAMLPVEPSAFGASTTYQAVHAWPRESTTARKAIDFVFDGWEEDESDEALTAVLTAWQ